MMRGRATVAAVPAALGASGALARALPADHDVVEVEPAGGESPLDPTAFMAPRHARSHRLFRAIERVAAARRLVKVVFEAPEDAFTTVTARALTGALADVSVEVLAGDPGEPSPLATREALLDGAFRDGALRHLGPTPPPSPLPTRGPLVSVIVPHYNLGTWLPETLASVARQRYRDFEIVLVDDGSTDAASVEAFERAEAPNLRKVRQANGGLAAARNAGLAAARGELVLPLDADDLIAEDYIAAAVLGHERVPGLAFITSYVEHFRVTPGDLPGFGYVPLGLHAPTMFLGNYASTCCALIRRSALDAVGGYDPSWPSYEDWDVWCAMAARGMQAAVLPRVGFFYRYRDASMVRTTARAQDRELRARLIRKHAAAAPEAVITALLAHLAVAPDPDARAPRPSRLETLRAEAERRFGERAERLWALLAGRLHGGKTR